MALEALKDALPAYAKDLKLNLSSLERETALTQQQAWGTWLASALATGVPAVIEAVAAEARQKLEPAAYDAAKTAAALMVSDHPSDNRPSNALSITPAESYEFSRGRDPAPLGDFEVDGYTIRKGWWDDPSRILWAPETVADDKATYHDERGFFITGEKIENRFEGCFDMAVQLMNLNYDIFDRDDPPTIWIWSE